MSYVGIDFDTHAVHLVRLEEGGQASYSRCELSGHDAFERTRDVRRAMPFSSFWDDVVAVAIEEPAGRLTGRMFRVQGAVLACIPKAKLVEKFMPSEWRKLVGLPGNASKGYVRVFAIHARTEFFTEGPRTYYREPEPWPQDACDAYCLALAVSRLVEVEAA